MTESEQPGVITGESAIQAMAPAPLNFQSLGDTPPEWEKAAGIPGGSPMWAAEVPDGQLRALSYLNSQGLYVLEISHVLATILDAAGSPKQGRPPHLWEVRFCCHRFLPHNVLMAMIFLPPGVPAPRPANCVLLTQVGHVDKPGLILV